MAWKSVYSSDSSQAVILLPQLSQLLALQMCACADVCAQGLLEMDSLAWHSLMAFFQAAIQLYFKPLSALILTRCCS